MCLRIPFFYFTLIKELLFVCLFVWLVGRDGDMMNTINWNGVRWTIGYR